MTDITATGEEPTADEALRESDSRYRSLYCMMRLMCDNVPDLIWAKDLDGTYIFVNKAMCETLLNASDVKEPIGKNYMFFEEREIQSHPDEPHWYDFSKACRDSDKIVIESRKAGRFEESGTVKGEFLCLDVLKAPFWDNHGEMIGTVGCARDITREKIREAERDVLAESLRESETKYRSLFDSANDGIFVLRGGRFVECNRKSLEIFGREREAIIGLAPFGLSPEFQPDGSPSREKALSILSEAVEGKEQLFEWQHSRGDGTVFDAEVSITRLEPGPDPLLLAVVREVTERKRGEAALRSSEQMLKRILHALPVGIGLSRNRKMLWSNDAWAHMFGLADSSESVDRHVRDLFLSVEDYLRVVEPLCSHLETGVINALDAQVKKEDGTPFHAHVRTTALDPTDLNAGVITVISDISERKAAEAALEKSKAMLHGILHAAQTGIGIVSDRYFRWTNRKISQMTGYTTDELCGRSARILYASDEEFDRVGKIKYREGNEKGISQVETKWKRKDGTIIDVLVSSAPVLPGDMSQGVVFTAMDITAMNKSREAQSRLATAVEQAEEVIEITDVTGAIQYVNPAFERTTGYSKSEVIGKNPSILQSGEHGDAFYKRLWNTITKGKVWKGRFINRAKDGTILHEDAVISPVRDSKGRIVNFVAVKRDVTQELALQQQLLHAQKMEAIGILAGGIAHDFNNLLQVTSGFSELLLVDKDETHPEYKDLMKILRAARNGADLVQRLLTFSRKVEPAPVPLNINLQVRDVERLLRRTIPKMISIELDLAEDVSSVFADPTQMEQLLMNLALNARDAMPEGGRLRMVTRNVTLDKDFCASYVGVKPGDYVALTVSDTGHGMDKETLNHIFEPFYTTKELGRGTGLGLAMVYGIVKQHEGLIVCQSTTGEGTSFHVYLPVIQAAVETTFYMAQELPAFGTETVLLVDDDTSVRELGRRFLEKAGYTVLLAEDGTQALTVFGKERERIALVILDLIMPGMGGMECLRELMKIDSLAKVIVASGHADDESREQAQALGARGFVRKPYIGASLLQQVRGVLDMT